MKVAGGLMVQGPDRLIRRLTRGMTRSPSILRTFVAIKPAATVAIILTVIAAVAVSGILIKASSLSVTEAREPPFTFKRQESVSSNEIHLESEYEWGEVESFTEETELSIKAGNDLEMELEYERTARTPDYVAKLKWKVEIEVESEILFFIDKDGNGGFDEEEDKVVMEKKLVFKEIQWFLDPDGQENTFLIMDEEGFVEAHITILGGFSDPDGTSDNEPQGSFRLILQPICTESSIHVAIEVKADFQYPDFDSKVEGYLVSSCSQGMTETWSFPATEGASQG